MPKIKKRNQKSQPISITMEQFRILNPKKYQEVVDTYRNAVGTLAFIHTIVTMEVDKHVGRLQSVLREENLMSDLPLCREVDKMRYIANKMISYLEMRSRTIPVSTRSWLNTYEIDYHSECRHIHNIQHLVYSSCHHLILDMEQKADVICINADVKSQGILKCLLKITSWLNWSAKAVKNTKKEWKELTNCTFPTTNIEYFSRQQTDMAKACIALEELIGVVECDNKRPMWQQFEKAESTLRSTILAMTHDDKFDETLWIYLSRDWLQYYFARAIIDTATHGQIPDAVIRELTQAHQSTGKNLLRPATTLITYMAGKFHQDSDPYDVVDQLQENPVAVIEDLIQVALDRLGQTEEKTSADKETE